MISKETRERIRERERDGHGQPSRAVIPLLDALEKTEARLRAAEDVLRAMKEQHGRHELTCSVCSAVADYDEAAKE